MRMSNTIFVFNLLASAFVSACVAATFHPLLGAVVFAFNVWSATKSRMDMLFMSDRPVLMACGAIAGLLGIISVISVLGWWTLLLAAGGFVFGAVEATLRNKPIRAMQAD